MEQITLKVESIQPALRRDKTTIEGVGKSGRHWQLFKINQKYSYFHHGEGKPDFTLGQEYPFDLETKQDGEFTNYQITRPKRGTKQTPIKEHDQGEIIIRGLGLIRGDIKRVEDIVKNIESSLIGEKVDD